MVVSREDIGLDILDSAGSSPVALSHVDDEEPHEHSQTGCEASALSEGIKECDVVWVL